MPIEIQKASSPSSPMSCWKDFTFPRDSLLPLQDDVFADTSIRIPANPRDFLSWEYGQCLGAHVWPWRMLLYTPQATEALHLILALKGAVLLLGSSGMNVFPPFVLICCMAAAVAILKSGLLYVSILFLSLCESLVLFLRPDWCIFRRLHSAIIVLVVAMCLHALQGSIQQLICQLDDFYLHPRRPKSWTLCLLGRCWDFWLNHGLVKIGGRRFMRKRWGGCQQPQLKNLKHPADEGFSVC